ncbi:MAG: hypothetical protein LQ342_000023 [Letrouitia transgressa]|nr:MAG: hypothetical protein LQ342_000023 [Letrouitia transgressa]
MANLSKFPRSPQCFFCLQRCTGIDTGGVGSIFNRQVRGKKKSARQPVTVKIRLLEDLKGFGRKGAIIPVAAGRMRNIFYPQQKAEYITQVELRALKKKDVVIERDFKFGIEQESAASAEDREEVVEIETRLLPSKQATEIISTILPPKLVFYTSPIPNTESEVKPSEPSGRSINAIGGNIEPRSQDELVNKTTRIFGSVTTADIADSIKAMLAQNELGRRVVLGAEAISTVKRSENDPGVEADRLKALGEFDIEIRIKGGDVVRRAVSVRAQDGQRS